MEKEELQQSPQDTRQNKPTNQWQIALNVLLVVGVIFSLLFSISNFQNNKTNKNQIKSTSENELEEIKLLDEILPKEGVTLPIKWKDLGKKMVETGVIDAQKFEALYTQRKESSEEIKNLLYNENNGNLVINDRNSDIILNLLWAFGLSNKNEILESGPMTDPNYGGPQIFASTGGWTISKGDVMNHYSKHTFISLNPTQQKLVEKVSKNIYRPCCNNSTYFPDCNHGMAMLGLLELLASQNITEEEMYKIALQVNAYWFPETYLTIAKYLQTKNQSWQNINPKEILGFDFSSAYGYSKILAEIQPVQIRSGGSCGI